MEDFWIYTSLKIKVMPGNLLANSYNDILPMFVEEEGKARLNRPDTHVARAVKHVFVHIQIFYRTDPLLT